MYLAFRLRRTSDITDITSGEERIKGYSLALLTNPLNIIYVSLRSIRIAFAVI